MLGFPWYLLALVVEAQNPGIGGGGLQQEVELILARCSLEPSESKAHQAALGGCFEHLLGVLGASTEDEEVLTPTCVGMMRGLGSFVAKTRSMRSVCDAAVGINVTALACHTLLTIAADVLAVALRSLAICNLLGADQVEPLADESFSIVGDMLQQRVETHADSPLGCFLGPKLLDVRQDLLSTLSPSSHTRQLVARLLVVARKIGEHANYIVWRDMHFLWVSDSLREGRVVHSSWGPIEHWDELGANDARNQEPLAETLGGPPAFAYSEEPGTRRDILVSLLQKLHDAKGGAGELRVVEVGVFRAVLSKYVLEKLPFVRLLGVDPYIGTDGTFPGDFSQTLDPDSALATAQAVYQGFGGRAQLMPTTSEVAAQQVPDLSVDAVFVDGCHLYECVVQDFGAWLPKLRGGGGSLMAGHDFSPQWPGVVRAVHERRGGGQRVSLGLDWTYWRMMLRT